MICAVLPALVRPLVEPHLPDDVDAHWFMSSDEAAILAPQAEIGWFDMMDKTGMLAPVKAATEVGAVTRARPPFQVVKAAGMPTCSNAREISPTD